MTRAPTHAPTLPLARPVRRTVLVVHLLAAGTWIGVDVVLGVLVLTVLGGDPTLVPAALQVLPLLFWPLLTAGLVSLLSGLLLGLGTRYGLLRHWWVAIKLALNLVLVTLVVVLLGPGLRAAPTLGPDPTMVFPPAVSLTALTAAVVLSVVKPWGRVRRGK
jgi:hypothetical protein